MWLVVLSHLLAYSLGFVSFAAALAVFLKMFLGKGLRRRKK